MFSSRRLWDAVLMPKSSSLWPPWYAPLASQVLYNYIYLFKLNYYTIRHFLNNFLCFYWHIPVLFFVYKTKESLAGSPCEYDEGSPLVQVDGTDTAFVVGLVSKTYGCSSTSYAIYTRVSVFYAWMQRTAGPQPTPAPFLAWRNVSFPEFWLSFY